MLEVLKSNTALFWIFSIAFVMQVVGVGLVVSDIIRVNRLSARYQTKIDETASDYEQRMTLEALRAAAQEREDQRAAEHGEQYQGDEPAKAELRAALGPLILARSLEVRRLNDLAKLGFDYHADKEERPIWLTWLGPVALILGICIGFAGTLLSKR